MAQRGFSAHAGCVPDAYDDLALVGRRIIKKPVRHILSSILVDRTSWPDGFRIFWVHNCLFTPKTFLPLTFGDVIYPEMGGSWSIEKSGIQQEFANRIENIGLPDIRSVNSLEDYYKFAMSGESPPIRPLSSLPSDKIYVDIALGDLDAAATAYEEILSKSLLYPPVAAEPETRTVLDIVGPKILARDRAGLAALLHGLEAFNVKKLKLEKIWQPTPFPLETSVPG